jgi:hypothetical protein
MRRRLILTALLVMAAASPPVLAQPTPQERGGIKTETQRRLANKSEFPLDLLGLVGLVGLLGFARRHPDDSYHPAPLE